MINIIGLENGQVWYNRILQPLNLYIKDGRIVEVTEGYRDCDERYDLRGGIVLPGAVDMHAHFREPGEHSYKGNFQTESESALRGGITLAGVMPNTVPPIIDIQTLESEIKSAEKSLINVLFYVAATNGNIENLPQFLKNLEGYPVAGVKVYMSDSTGNIGISPDNLEKVFRAVTESPYVLCVHAEDPDINRIAYERSWGVFGDDPIAHAYARPPVSEIIAVQRALNLAEKYGTKLHVCHVSTREALERILKAIDRGVDVSWETCPHYLLMTIEHLKELGTHAKMNPPLRRGYDREFLWENLREHDARGMVVSDHAPHTIEEKLKPIKDAPSGIPGIGTILFLLLNEVNEGRLTMEDVVRLTHDYPVERFSLGGHGNIEINRGANLTVIDIKRRRTLGVDLAGNSGWTPYEGWEVIGRTVMTVVNGEVYELR